MIVRILAICVLAIALAESNDQSQIEKYSDKVKRHQVEVPERESITTIETEPSFKQLDNKWKEIPIRNKNDNGALKNSMDDIIHDTTDNPRCFGPSCQEGFDDSEGPQEYDEDYILEKWEKMNELPDFPVDKLQAINALAAKLKRDKYKGEHYFSTNNNQYDQDQDKVHTSWNRLKVKQHKHPFDDKDGWITLEPIPWSTSTVSKWKPNVKKQKPVNSWNTEDNRFPDEDKYVPYHGMKGSSYDYSQNKPLNSRPAYINNKLHVSTDYDNSPEIPSKPIWNRLHQNSYNYPASWLPDSGRRPTKHNCNNDESNSHNDEAVYYGVSDSVITDVHSASFPYEYEALHQATMQKRPIKRPTQVIYAGSSGYENDISPKPAFSDGQWVLLSTTKGYRNKKRQRSLNPTQDEPTDSSTVRSHQVVGLTVLPMENSLMNMTTSHGGMLEVEKSFLTVEESKRDLDKLQDSNAGASTNIHQRPQVTKVIKRKLVANNSPDSSTILTAVGAGMVPATMAMVVPMMLGRRRRRRDVRTIQDNINLDNIFRI